MAHAAIEDRTTAGRHAQPPERWLARHTTKLDEALRSIRGLTMKDEHRGTLAAGSVLAELRVEPHQWIRIDAILDTPPEPWDALRVNHWLPGNLRYAQAPGRMALVAETMINGVAHLADSLGEIRRGLRSAARNADRQMAGPLATRLQDDLAVDRQALASALERLPFGEQSLIEREATSAAGSFWEVRPRVAGEPVAVLVEWSGGRVRLGRTVLTGPRPSAPLADQALRLNSRFRLCRLALAGEDLVVETLLHAGVIEPAWLAAAAHAVATASRYGQAKLEALVRHEPAARWYATLLLPKAVARDAR
ncbi:MAG: hypothetical protein NUV77_01625 [Thermoguttaceae bacterium]|jgi:hypothetical protein|nr:hypothetical protein [Thermoguttaceae bacterium]